MDAENCDSEWDLPLSALFPLSSTRKRRRNSSEGKAPPSPISKLGDDLLVEILIRSFPNPRSAYRRKVVCKLWSSVISDASFNRRFVAHQQMLNLNQPPMPDDQNELQSIILSFLPPVPSEIGAKLRVLDCFKDLVLCGFWDFDCDNNELCRSYLVCNPFTKQWMALPLAPEKSKGYVAPVARLVCEPRSNSNCELDLGDDQVLAYSSEYRFRVVCIYAYMKSVKVDLFCSESGKWTKEALVRPGNLKVGTKNVPSCNGELFWVYIDLNGPEFDIVLTAWNPFRLDIPPTRIDVTQFVHDDRWDISVSQGTLHVVELDGRTVPTFSSVWRLEEDRKSWTKQCEMLLEVSPGWNYEPDKSCQPSLHPNKAEILFLHCLAGDDKSAILSCDLRRGELEFFAKEILGRRFTVFQPMRVACWPTPIPRYEELRGMYNGSYSYWVQSSCEATTASLDNRHECQLVDPVEQFGHRMKDNISTSHPGHRVKKQNVVKVSCSNKQYGAIGRRLSIR